MTTVVDKQKIEQILKSADPKQLLGYIEESFVAYSSKNATVPPVGTLSFDSPPGDVHIKYGYIRNQSHYVIKIASGFYKNPEIGLSSSNGLNLVFNQTNGLLETILLDEGLLTDVRTALAGAIAAKHLGPSPVRKIGIVGTGIQARLQLKYLSTVTDCDKVMVWGRTPENTRNYQQEMNALGYQIEIVDDPGTICNHCNLIVTTTPSTSPILPGNGFTGDVLITAMGADTPGKQELEHSVLQRASLIVTDSESQCTSHGEIHKAYKLGELEKINRIELGKILMDKEFKRPSGLIIADLTGIATQDIQISRFILDSL